MLFSGIRENITILSICIEITRNLTCIKGPLISFQDVSVAFGLPNCIGTELYSQPTYCNCND